MDAYSLRLRDRIMFLYGRGMKTLQIAELTGLCRSGVRRVKQRFHQHGTHQLPSRGRGRKSGLTPEVAAALSQCVARRPDARRWRSCRPALLESCGTEVSVATIDRWTRKLGLSYKKSRSGPPSRSVRTSRPRREVWHADLNDVDPAKLIFLDEAGAKTDMARLRGRCPAAERLTCYPARRPLVGDDDAGGCAAQRPVRRRGDQRGDR